MVDKRKGGANDGRELDVVVRARFVMLKQPINVRIRNMTFVTFLQHWLWVVPA